MNPERRECARTRRTRWRWAFAALAALYVSLILLGPAGERYGETCRVCGRVREVYSLPLLPAYHLSPDGYPSRSFPDWFDRHVHIAHEHDWAFNGGGVRGIPMILVLRVMLDHSYEPLKSRLCFLITYWDVFFGGPHCSNIQRAMLAMPDQSLAIQLATRVAHASPAERLTLLEETTWGPMGRDPRCAAVNQQLWEPLENVLRGSSSPTDATFPADYRAWINCHPHWQQPAAP